MLDLGKDIRSLSDFKRNTGDFVDQMRDSGNPLVLTINGKAELVVQDASAYQRLLDRLDELETVEAALRGRADVEHGRVKSLDTLELEIRERNGLPRRGK